MLENLFGPAPRALLRLAIRPKPGDSELGSRLGSAEALDAPGQLLPRLPPAGAREAREGEAGAAGVRVQQDLPNGEPGDSQTLRPGRE